MKLKAAFLWMFPCIFMAGTACQADEVFLQNGDRYSGNITEAAGTVLLQRKFVRDARPEQKILQKGRFSSERLKLWNGEVSLGTRQKSGRYGKRAAEVAARTVLKQHKKKRHPKGK